jgi:hypothetical protein
MARAIRRWAAAALAGSVALGAVGCGTDPSEPSPPAASRAIVTCGADGARATTPVAVQPDGVHFTFDAPEDQTAIVGDGRGDEPDEWLSGSGQAVSTLLGTGTYEVACRDAATDRVLPVRAPLEIIDPGGLWLEDRLTCADRVVGVTDYIEGAEGEHGDLIAALRRHVTGLRPGDQVTRAGYPVSENREVRVVRDGTVVAVATYGWAGPGAWLLRTFAVCGSSGISG